MVLQQLYIIIAAKNNLVPLLKKLYKINAYTLLRTYVLLSNESFLMWLSKISYVHICIQYLHKYTAPSFLMVEYQYLFK